jgi:hypothetical protein
VTTVVGVLAGIVMAGGPASGDDGSLTTVQNYSVVPWVGTITVEWREERDKCIGCISSIFIDSGRLVYTITGGSTTTQSPDWSSYQASANGSGTFYSRLVTEDGTEECTGTWTAIDRRVDGLRIGITAPTMSPGSVMVEEPTDGCAFSLPVGDFPSDGIGDGPDNEPYIQRPINDSDPNPNILRGTTVFAAQPNWDQLKAYTYTLTYDLRREILYKATVKWPRSPWAGATYRTRISVPGNTKKFRPWISTGKARMHVFKRLSLGKYVVEIQAISKSGKKGPALTKAFKVTTAFRVSD